MKFEKSKAREAIENIKQTEITTTEGDIIHVKEELPYEQMEQMMWELAGNMVFIDEENGAVGMNFRQELLFPYLIVKYYTDIDLSEVQTEEDIQALYDWLKINPYYDLIRNIISCSFNRVMLMADAAVEATKSIYAANTSLPYLLRKSFGSALGSEELSEAISKSDELNRTLVDMMGAVKEKEEREKADSASGKKLKAKNGLMLNLAKK